MRWAPGVAIAAMTLALSACGGAVQISASPSASTTTPPNDSGFLGELSASVAQNQVAELSVPSWFVRPNLLVALVAADGPDTYPTTHVRVGTTAVFGGSAGLQWKRAARESARHDVAAGHSRHERYGASIAEIWTAVPPPGWNAGGVVTVTTTHPETHDDGLVITIAAFARGRLERTPTKDGLHTRPERLTATVAAGDDLFAALFEGRVNANFVPLPGFRADVQRRAGDDTASVLESDRSSLPAGAQTVGFASPNPGDYWEMAVAVIAPN